MTDKPDEEELRMTETPDWLPDPDDEQRMQEFFGDVPDIPDTYHKYDKDSGSLIPLSTEERIQRWRAAQKRSLEKGTSARGEFTADLLERSRAAKGPNPTQEKARTLYEWWRTGCGAENPGLLRPYDKLRPHEQQRWAALAKALGGKWIDGKLCHDLTPAQTSHTAQDAMRYKDIPADLSWAEYDDVLNPRDPGYQKLRQHWWQFWRPRHEKLTTSS